VESGTGILPAGSRGLGILPMSHGLEGDPKYVAPPPSGVFLSITAEGGCATGDPKPMPRKIGFSHTL